jgi:hypothetical protein
MRSCWPHTYPTKVSISPDIEAKYKSDKIALPNLERGRVWLCVCVWRVR